MGVRNSDFQAKARVRATATVSGVANDSAILCTIDAATPGLAQQSHQGCTALIESIPAGAKVEMWLAQVADGTVLPENASFFYSGQCLVPTGVAFSATGETASFGFQNWFLSGYPAVQFRVKNVSGAGGSCTISATAY